jgi:hypothetical protein
MRMALGKDGKLHAAEIEHTFGGWTIATECRTPGVRPVGVHEARALKADRLCPSCWQEES